MDAIIRRAWKEQREDCAVVITIDSSVTVIQKPHCDGSNHGLGSGVLKLGAPNL